MSSAALAPALEPTLQWYAVYVRSKQEKMVESTFKGKGYPAFSPVCRMRKKQVNRTREVDVPLFPGYVFCQFDAKLRLPILVTPGVVHVVSAGNQPLPVAEREIGSLQTVMASGRPVQPWPFLKEGQTVRIEAGPLSGALGKFVRIKDEFRLVVQISLLQRAISVELDQDSVSPAFN